MSQSRFSIVLVGVSALLRRPFVSRLRSAGFTARGSGGFRRSVSPSVSEIAARRVGLRAPVSAFRHAPLRSCRWAGWFFCLPLRSYPRRVGLRAHDFRFSACAASELPLGGLAFGLTASAFRHAPLRGCPRRVGSAAFRFGVALGELVLLPFASGLLLGGLAFGLTASAFWHAPLRDCHSASWPSGSRLPLFGMHRFGVTLGELVLLLGGLVFGLTASAFRHAPLRSCCSAGWPSGSQLPLFGMRRFGDCRSAG